MTQEGKEETQNVVIAMELESKIVGNTMNSWQVLLIKWRKIKVVGEQPDNTDDKVNGEGANFEKVDFL